MLGLGISLLKRKSSGGVSYILDENPGATRAYSLRELSSSWVGQPVVKIRRASDNAELDFSASEVADGTVTAWVGASNGLITTWYDQSGNNVNAVQANTTSQPTLVQAGVLITENGLPAINFVSASSNDLRFTSTTLSGDYCIVMIMNSTTANNNHIGLAANSSNSFSKNSNPTVRACRINAFVSGPTFNFNIGEIAQYSISFVDRNAGNINCFDNNFASTSNPTAYATNSIFDSIFSRGGFSFANGGLQELIIWNGTSLIGNKDNILNNANEYYSIY